MTAAVSFIGWSGSGKTTLLTRLIPELRARGVKVAVVKHSGHPHPLHPSGSDTAQLEKAGAAPVAFATPEGVSLTWAGKPEELLPALLPHFDAELILIEGWKQGPFPKIEVWRKELGPLLAATTPVLAVVSDDELPAGLTVRRFTTAEVSGLALYFQRLAREGAPPA